MKFGLKSVVELAVFDENENLIACLDTLKYSRLYLEESHGNFIEVEDALLDIKILEFIGKVESTKYTDYEKMAFGFKNQTTMTINKKRKHKCKLVGSGVMRSQDTGTDIPFRFVAPNATFNSPINIETDGGNPETFIWKFDIKEFNENGDLVKLTIG